MSLFTLTVPSHATRVEYRHGAVVRVLEPGRHPRRWRGAWPSSRPHRAETAALRSLANGARLLDAHPALARQRLVQSAPDGATVVLRFGDAGDPGTGATAT